MFDEQDHDRRQDAFVDASDFIIDIREYDVPYHVRVAIDKGEDFVTRGTG
jgi:DNA polymerase epsilon subunit 1